MTSRRSEQFRIAVRKYGPFETAIAAQWNAFAKAEGCALRLEVTAMELIDLENALLDSRGMAAGTWDVAFVPTDWVASVAKLQCAVDLGPLLKAEPPEGWPDAWSPSLRALQTVGESVVGVPYHDGPECLIWRKDLFEDKQKKAAFLQRFGRELRPPVTWAEFQEVARFFTQPERGLYGTAFAGFPDGHNSVYDFLLQLWTRGGELVTADGSIQFSTPEASAALEFYRAMMRDIEAVPADCMELDSVGLGARFAAGKLAMMVNWFGFATAAHTGLESKVRRLVETSLIPCEANGQSVSLNVYWLLCVASGSPHRDIAWRFLRHTMRPEMDRLTTLEGAIGCRRSTWTDPDVNREIPFYWRMEQLHQVAQQIPQRDDWPEIAKTIDSLMTRTATTDIPVALLLREAQEAHS